MTIHADDPLFLRLAFTRGVSARVAHKLLSELGDINTLFAASTSTISTAWGQPARAISSAGSISVPPAASSARTKARA